MLFILCEFQCFSADNNNNSIYKTENTNKNIDNSNKLLAYGYPEDVIEKLTDTAVNYILSTIEHYDVYDVNCKTEDLQKSSEENAEIILMSITAKLKDSNSNKLVGESICIYWEWTDTPPLIREKDYISVNWNKDVLCFKQDSFYAEDYSKDKSTDNWEVANTYSVLDQAGIDTLGHWTDLKKFKNCIGGVMIFNLSATLPVDTDSELNDNLKINYSHKTETLNTVLSISPFIIVPATVVLLVLIKKKKH